MKVGFVGWRGMVGSVLMGRMRAENDFDGLEPVFFSTSQVGEPAPDVGRATPALQDAKDIDALASMDAIVTCQGGEYTKAVYGPLREAGWKGYWIDAASTLRMAEDSVIVLDPVNGKVIDRALDNGVRTYVGGNCTVSLLLMAIGGLLEEDLVEWVSPMTYQAASGAGAQNMREMVQQMGVLAASAHELLDEPGAAILEIDRRLTHAMRDEGMPIAHFGVPLVGSLIPWIDSPMEGGRTREEWKAQVEANKILGRTERPVPIDGICVRIGAMRCHAQALTIKLRRSVALTEVESMLDGANDWFKVVPNEPEPSKHELTPAAVTGTLDIPIGRLRHLSMGPEYLTAFTVGDQLLWGAAEPLRRMLRILRST